MSSIALAIALSVLTLTPDPSRAVRGGGESFLIKSEILGETRRVFVHLPPSFAKNARRYPAIVAFDGELVFRPLVTTSGVLAEQGQIPEAVIVAIDNIDDYDGRVRDLTPPGMSVSGSGRNQGGERFLDFIEKELLPAVDARFRSGPPRVLVGTSSGGILATWAAATRDTYRFVLALDAPTHLESNFVIRKLMERTRNAAPLHYVSMDVRYGWSDAAWKSLTEAAPKSWLLHREKLARESHTSMQFLGTYLGMRELFRDYSRLGVRDLPTTSILPAYDALRTRYGAAVVPPASLLRQVVEDLLMEGRGAMARAALDLLAASYGEPRDIANLRAEIAEVQRRPPPAETVEGLLAMPFPAPAELRDYLGVWRGRRGGQRRDPDRARCLAAEHHRGEAGEADDRDRRRQKRVTDARAPRRGDGADEPVAAAAEGLEIPRRVGGIVERCADLADAVVQAAVEVDERVVVPDRLAQLLARDEIARAPGQHGQHPRRLLLQLHRRSVAMELERAAVEREAVEADDPAGHFLGSM